MILQPSFMPIDMDPIEKQIEFCGRICYKSEDKITEGSYVDFIKQRIQDKHFAILEHGSESFIIKNIPHKTRDDIYNLISLNPYLEVTKVTESLNRGQKGVVCSGNLRAWYEFFRYNIANEPTIKALIFSYFYFKHPVIFEPLLSIYTNNLLTQEKIGEYFFQYNNEVDIKKHIFLTVKFVINRKMSHELVRHRRMSFMQESTRYVNYKKYGVSFVLDETIIPKKWRNDLLSTIRFFNIYITDMYLGLKSSTKQSQIASLVLPQITKTELIITGRLADWDDLITKRTSDAVYPELKNLMIKFKDKFYNPYIKSLKGA